MVPIIGMSHFHFKVDLKLNYQTEGKPPNLLSECRRRCHALVRDIINTTSSPQGFYLYNGNRTQLISLSSTDSSIRPYQIIINNNKYYINNKYT